MPSYLFSTLLLLLLVSSALCSATSIGPGVELFKVEPINALKPNGTGHEEVLIVFLEYPSLVLANGVMVGQVCAPWDYYEGYLLTKYIGTGVDGWAGRAIDGGEYWKAQSVWESKIVRRGVSVLAAKNDTIYSLHASYSNAYLSEKQWDFLLSIGEVTHGYDGAISIVWTNKTVEKPFSSDIQSKLKFVDLVYGSSFVMEDGTLVFVFTGKHGSSRFYIIAYSREPSTDLMFHFDDKTAPNCYSTCFSWGKKLFMFPLRCAGDASNYKLRESDNMGKTWRESSGKLAQSLKGKSLTSTYTPITIGERHLLLFTEAKKNTNNTYDVNLFVAYNDSIEPLGNIFIAYEDFVPGSLLYTKDELFYLGSHKRLLRYATLFRLKRQLETMKKLLDDMDAAEKQTIEAGTSSVTASNETGIRTYL